MFSRRGFLTAAGAAGVLAELPVRGMPWCRT
ncbi:twin-arginine translocation signal domain-containing protein [Leisingera sp. NJS201]|nr:twin-arginine translocation signal domain-containing protein [Leisingera sp. NJS201]QBR35362.1 twin-arginine translocation signal domain-containing protein [Leisingera sp. NJS201]